MRMFACWKSALKLALGVCMACSIVTQVYSQTPASGIPRGLNEGFEEGLNSWITTNEFATVVRTSQGPEFPTGEFQLKLEGVAAAWQYLPVSPQADLQLLVCEALKKNRAGDAQAGWSGIGINYFTADWAFITGFERQISDKNKYTLPNEPGLELIPANLGVRAPAGAVHSIMWISNNDAASDVIADKLQLLDYQPAANDFSAFGVKLDTLPSVLNEKYRLTGLEFWDIFGFVDPASGGIGWTGSSCAISQEIRLDVAQIYEISIAVGTPRPESAPTATFGLDFYDENWQRIDGVFDVLAVSDQPQVAFLPTVVPPPNTAHSILWVWSDRLSSEDIAQQVNQVAFGIQPALPLQ